MSMCLTLQCFSVIIILSVAILFPVITITGFLLDSKLRSRVGGLLIIYMTIIFFRNSLFIYFIFHLILGAECQFLCNLTQYGFAYFEFCSVYCQKKIIHNIYHAVSSNLPVVTEPYKHSQFICQLVLLLGKSALIVNFMFLSMLGLFILLFYFDPDTFYKIKPLTPGLLMIIGLPLALYNSTKCVLVGLKVRAVRKAVNNGQCQVNGGPQLKWYTLLVKIIFMSGIVTDLTYSSLYFINLNDVHNSIRNIVFAVWIFRGVEVFFLFVFKKIWRRIRKKFGDILD